MSQPTEPNKHNDREVTKTDDMVAVHVGTQYKKDKKLTLKGRRIYTPLFMVVFALLGLWYLGQSIAGPTQNNVADEKCGARVENYTYQVPYGDAAWNVPVCDLPRHSNSDEYAYRFYNYAALNDETPATEWNRGKINIGFGLENEAGDSFARTVYYASDATTTRRVRVCANGAAGCLASNFDGDDLKQGDPRQYLPDRKIPWNPDWKLAEGEDAELYIIDDREGHPDEGQLITFHRLILDPVKAIGQCGFIATERLCAASAQILRDHEGNIADYRTFEGSTGDRGAGISYFATTVTPEEVLAGEIRHAMGITLFGTAVGPECTPEQLGTEAEGTICGTAVAPAGKFEWKRYTKLSDRAPRLKDTPTDYIYSQDKLIPEGMRFALDIDDTDIENWITSRPDLRDNPVKANTARIFANALRDYGVMAVDTSGNGLNIQAAGAFNPDAKKKWAELGITKPEDKSTLLAGLMTEDDIYVIEPPVNSCLDGTKSQYYCEYSSSTYPTIDSTDTDVEVDVDNQNTDNPDTSNEEETTTRPPIDVEPTPTTETTIEPIVSPTQPQINGALEVGFWWERFIWHYSIKINYASTSPDGIKHYVVKRNGQEVYKGLNRTYQDFNIASGGKYNYQVQAVSTKDAISKPSVFDGTVQCTWVFCSIK